MPFRHETDQTAAVEVNSSIEISFVIVTWNCRDFVLQCLRSIHDNCSRPFEVVVVDNGSTDGTTTALSDIFPSTRIIRNSENLGFAAANNVGIRASGAEYLALVNPDVVVLPGCIDIVVDALRTNPTIGMVGPSMLDAGEIVRRSGMRFPNVWRSVSEALLLHRIFPGTPLFGGQLMHDFDWKSRRDVDVLNGWFWLIRRDAIDQAGLLDERFFMYGEDVDWCKRFRESGWRVVFEPAAESIHFGGGSSRNAPVRFYLELENANLQYWAKHHGLPSRIAYTIVRTVHHGLRFVAYSLLLAVGRNAMNNRAKAARHAAAAQRMFGSLLGRRP